MARVRGDKESIARLLALTLACACALAAGIAAREPAGAAAQAPQAPNVILVMTDDQSAAQLNRRVMPRTLAALGGPGGGTKFTRAYASSPLCCPSRAGFLTGQYPHNSGVFDNTPGYESLVDKESTLYTWLDSAGYQTGHVGRFLLRYSEPGGPPSPNPPGVDDWYGYDTNPTHYLGAPFSQNGVAVRFPRNASGYTTRVINNHARAFIDHAAPSADPFFLWVAHIAPHVTHAHPRQNCGAGAPLNEPGKNTFSAYRDEPLPHPPSLNERSTYDKPQWVESQRPLNPRALNRLERAWRCALAALTSVDRGVNGILRTLRAQGELEQTVIFFVSDNGLLYGEHRLSLDKVFPYEESWRVPLLARIPSTYLGGATPPQRISAVASTIDVTATILSLTGVSPCVAGGECRTLDGRSLLPLLGGPGEPWPGDRAVLAQIGNRQCGTVPVPGSGMRNHYDAIRTAAYSYVELNRVNPDTGVCDRPEWELYDVLADRYQLRNIAVDPAVGLAEPQATLANRLHALAGCSGIAGRDPQATDPEGLPLPYCE
jgi:arylsulfatase A-like enzyme